MLDPLSNKKETNPILEVKIPIKAVLRVLEVDSFKSFKKLRHKGTHVLVQVPTEFINGHYNAGLRYSITMAYEQGTNHKIILMDLDDNRPAINNRR